MLRIQGASNGKIVFSLTGRIGAEGIDESRKLFGLKASTVRIGLNLKKLVLADGDSAGFLGVRETSGMTVKDCRPTHARG